MDVLQAVFSSYFISLEKGKFVFQKSLSETPFKPDRVSFCTRKMKIGGYRFQTSSVAKPWSVVSKVGPELTLAWWTFRIFFIFFLLAFGQGGVSQRCWEGGGADFFFGRIQEGGSFRREGPKGRSGCLRRIGEFWGGGGGVNFFFSGPKCPPSKEFLMRVFVCPSF